MKKWSKKKTQLSLLLAFFSFFMFSSLRTDHRQSTTRSLPASEHFSVQPSFPTYFAINTSNPGTKKPVLGASDWSKACASTRSYKGKSNSVVEHQWQHESWSDGCDMFSGRWVYDNISYPLYDEGGCPYMSDQLACGKHGRPDKEYQKWRWQPHGCNLKRWNATEMLGKLRGKRLMFVGDSLNRGQWISMVCLIQSVIPAGKRSMSPNAALTIFRAEEYNASVEFYWAPLVVESNSDDPVNHRFDARIIRPDSIIKHASQWEKADILVFNSYLWWRSGSKIKLLWNREDVICEEANGLDAMKLTLETWADWVASGVDPRRQKVFFVTMSPTHLWSQEWNPGSEGNCFQEKTPIESEGYWGSGSDLGTMRMVESILGRLGPKVSVINITQLSEYRKDGHPSIYRKFWETLTPSNWRIPLVMLTAYTGVCLACLIFGMSCCSTFYELCIQYGWYFPLQTNHIEEYNFYIHGNAAMSCHERVT